MKETNAEQWFGAIGVSSSEGKSPVSGTGRCRRKLARQPFMAGAKCGLKQRSPAGASRASQYLV